MLAAAAAVAALGFGNVHAATVVWDGGTTGTGTTWLTGTNWNPDTTDLGPGVNDLAQFGLAGTSITIGVNPNNPTNNGTANQAIGQILLGSGINRTINNNGTAVDGVLTLNGIGGVMLVNATTNGTLTLANGGTRNLGVVLGASGEFSVVNPSATIAVTSVVSETGGARSILKSGAGTLTLGGANTFTGDVTVDNGTLNFASLANLGTSQSLGTAGTVNIGGATTAATLNYTGAAATTNRNFVAGSQGGTLNHANNITYSGTISGSGPFFKGGAGTLILTGANGRVSASSININGGTLRLDNATNNNNDRLDSSTSIGMFGGTLQFDGNRDIPTTEVASQLFAGGNGSTIRTTVAAGAANNASISFAGLSKGTGATLAFDIASGVDVNFASSTLANGIIGGWSTAGSNFATIDGNTGNVVQYASTVSNNPAVWGSSDNVKVTANATVAGAVNVNSVQLADNAGAPVTLTVNGPLALNSGGLIASAVSGHTIDGTGSITSLGNELYIHVPTAGHVLNVNATIADNGGGNVDLITTGPGTTVLNAANTFLGTAQINGGTLQMGSNGTLANNTVNVTGNGTFALNAQTKTIGALAGSGPVTLGAGGGALSTGANNASTTYSGVISGTGTLTKVGTGTMTLKGVNTFTGATNIGATDGVGAGGVLVVDADSRFGAVPGAATPGRINIYNGTLRLTGGVAQTTVVTSGGPIGITGVLVAAARGITLNAGSGAVDVPTGAIRGAPRHHRRRRGRNVAAAQDRRGHSRSAHGDEHVHRRCHHRRRHDRCYDGPEFRRRPGKHACQRRSAQQRRNHQVVLQRRRPAEWHGREARHHHWCGRRGAGLQPLQRRPASQQQDHQRRRQYADQGRHQHASEQRHAGPHERRPARQPGPLEHPCQRRGR
jgi:autotransporter-associated beta strand protein